MRNKLKTISIFIIIMFAFVGVFPIKAIAKEEKLSIDARCAIAIDAKSKVVLYEKSGYEIVPMASTTKIMTSLVAIKYGDLNKKIEISQNAANIRGSTVGFKKGEKVSLKELLYGLMLRSGNDAAIAISEGISGNVDEFVKLMNEYASEIGVVNTHFHSPHGLDYDDHYTTAYDLALITAKARENKVFNEIVSTKDIDGKNNEFTRSYHNINKILWEVPEADGVKTGFTGKAGKCLVTSAKVKGNDVIVVVLNCTPRWKETKKIYDFVNKNYEFKKMFSKDDCVGEFEIGKDKIKLLCKNDIVIPTKIGKEYNIKIIKPTEMKKSIKKGEEIGKVCIMCDGETIYTNNLIAGQEYKIRKLLRFLTEL